MFNKKELLLRSFTTFLLAAITITTIHLGDIFFESLVVAILGVCIYELSGFTDLKIKRVLFIFLNIIIFIFSQYLPSVLLLVFILSITSIKSHQLKISIYVLCIHIVALYLFELREDGRLLITWLCLSVITTDIGGFFFGRFFGGPKLLKYISPNKTWSGTIFGWILSIFICFIFLEWVDQNIYSKTEVIIITFFFSLFSQIGDLYESFLKRSVNKKDSSSLLPGHGGFLDRIDGLIGASLFLIFFRDFIF